MKFICDFHIHSPFSRATSKELVPESLNYWGAVKGIKVLGTGDFTHPGWLKELKEKLEKAENGLLKLKKEYRHAEFFDVPQSWDKEVRFMLTAEISTIYKKKGKVRKVHNLIFAPDFSTAQTIQKKLTNIGANITSDGRPILGLDSKDLLEMSLDVCGDIFFVPAHIWTPWFSVLGSKSGFDSIDECFEDLSANIHAVETGLSADPPMHWMCSFLDEYTLISNSDAHSPDKLGRNANIFDTELSYDAIIRALSRMNSSGSGFAGTIDLFPQEGKYHYDGHRKCGICWDPLETLKNKEVCPVCKGKITVGVMNRVAQLSDRDDLTERKNRSSFFSIIPLKEILSEIFLVGPDSQKVEHAYFALLRKLGPELSILIEQSLEDIEKIGGGALSEAIKRMRNREVIIKEGFDGEYGKITVFRPCEIKEYEKQKFLFKDEPQKEYVPVQKRKMINFDLDEYRILRKQQGEKSSAQSFPLTDQALNPEQKKAAEHFMGTALVIAGPGTGKTEVLANRIAYLIREKNINPENILAVTFTNRAASEMKNRLKDLLKGREEIEKIRITTFHAFGFSVLKENATCMGQKNDFTVIDDNDKEMVLSKYLGLEKKEIRKKSELISRVKQSLKAYEKIEDKTFREIFDTYNRILQKFNAFDFDDLIYVPVRLFEKHEEIVSYYRKLFSWILIDEYQDINCAQYEMIKKLMPCRDSNLFVIGDPLQAIYGFRGASRKFIENFMCDYANAAIYGFTKSYRCSSIILKASDDVVNRPGKKGLLEGIRQGIKIRIVKNSTEKSEAEFIARTVEQMIGGVSFFSMDSNIIKASKARGIESFSDFAVLCRITRQISAIEKAFNDHKIPYQTVKNLPFFKQEPALSIIDLVKLSVNPNNVFLKEKLAAKKVIYPAEALKLENIVKESSVKAKISAVIDIYGKRVNKTAFKDSEFCGRLFGLAARFENDIEAFMRFTDLGEGIDLYKPRVEATTIMTLHAAKGLEFKCVFIAGCEDGILPYSLFNKQTSPEEEARLLYVGMTRAKEYLFLSYAQKRFIHGRTHKLKPSPYLARIEKELSDLTAAPQKPNHSKKDIQLDLFPKF